MDNVKKSLADRLDSLISDLGIKQQDFARRIEFAGSYVSMVLSGAKTRPGPRFINAVCREFSVNPEWLVHGKEPVFSIPGVPLPPEKAEVLAKFLLLPDGRQRAVEDMIDALLLKTMTENTPK